jgi:hypothetical protein
VFEKYIPEYDKIVEYASVSFYLYIVSAEMERYSTPFDCIYMSDSDAASEWNRMGVYKQLPSLSNFEDLPKHYSYKF